MNQAVIALLYYSPPRSISMPLSTVVKMLDLCSISPGEVIADLGSGDGRIPILARTLFQPSRVVGIEREPVFAELSRELVQKLGLDGGGTEIICGDLLKSDLSEFEAITICPPQE